MLAAACIESLWQQGQRRLGGWLVGVALTTWLLGLALGRLYEVKEQTGIEEANMAWSHTLRGETAEALALYPVAISLRDVPGARSGYAELLREVDRSEEAVLQYRAIVAEHPDLELAWYNLGNVLWEDLRDGPGAAEAFQRAIAIKPNYPQAHFNLGVVRLQMRQWIAARRHVERALELDDAAEWRGEADKVLRILEERGH